MPIITPFTTTQREMIKDRAERDSTYNPRCSETTSLIQTLPPNEKARAEKRFYTRNSDPRLGN